MAVLIGRDLELADQHSGLAVQRGQRVAALVGVRSDHDHLARPFHDHR
jgi:hypothetical protein